MLDDHEELGRISVDHVESYPQDATGRKVSGSLLYNATPAVLESQGFKRLRRSGKHNWSSGRRFPKHAERGSAGLGAGGQRTYLVGTGDCCQPLRAMTSAAMSETVRSSVLMRRTQEGAASSRRRAAALLRST